MKIKGKFIIPLVALLIAIFTVGAVPGLASDTTDDITTSDTLTYVRPTPPSTSSIDEEIGAFISSEFSDELQDAEGPLRNFSEMMSDILTKIRDFLNSLINMLTGLGGGLGDIGGLLGDTN